ncbi:MAG: thiamine pyrophosphate-dependent enzyme [Candidatus Paceibacterota bacterium]|jgi:2-oxoglutarate ferredoxin oxidoreductase subunit beta|nr:thiamine pyrophosphate-dependent enzyme [Candidatus Paceibacterota bacterium]MDD5555403.1 thiamine pyrophosphate-dependent enzyme [Candidatus Paceibacterota bacterium]
MENLETSCPNTWCPGCGNFGVLAAVKKTVNSLLDQGVKKENIVLVSDIGCSSKSTDYLNLNSFDSLHGRSIATGLGIALANPDLKVIVVIGDGGALNEGIAHLVHAAKRNSNITILMHNNRLFALTTGQFTAVSPKGLKGKSTPEGVTEEPINPLELMLDSRASFIGRSYSAKIDHMASLIEKAVKHDGFSFIEILQPCVSFFNNFQFYNEKVYEIEDKERTKEEARKLIEEWNYNSEGKIPLGLLYSQKRDTYENLINKSIKGKEPDIKKCLQIRL